MPGGITNIRPILFFNCLWIEAPPLGLMKLPLKKEGEVVLPTVSDEEGKDKGEDIIEDFKGLLEPKK